MNDQTLNVRVGQNVVASLRSVAQTMKALDRGETPAPHFEIGFTDVAALQEWLAVEKDEAGLVYAPFTDIHADVHLPENTDSSKDEVFTHA